MLAAVDTVLDRYREHTSVSLRQLWYVLVSDGSGRIPWDAIRDDTQIAIEAPPSLAGTSAPGASSRP
ncbi:hypothetical protein WB388_03895 [Streptomyces brasiliscabiei]